MYDLLNLILAVLGLVVALLSVWFTHFRGFRPIVDIGAPLFFYRLDSVRQKTLSVAVPIHIMNEGARTGSISNLAITIDASNKALTRSVFIASLCVDPDKLRHTNVAESADLSFMEEVFQGIQIGPNAGASSTVLFVPDFDTDLPKLSPGTYEWSFWIKLPDRDFRLVSRKPMTLTLENLNSMAQGGIYAPIGSFDFKELRRKL